MLKINFDFHSSSDGGGSDYSNKFGAREDFAPL